MKRRLLSILLALTLALTLLPGTAKADLDLCNIVTIDGKEYPVFLGSAHSGDISGNYFYPGAYFRPLDERSFGSAIALSEESISESDIYICLGSSGADVPLSVYEKFWQEYAVEISVDYATPDSQSTKFTQDEVVLGPIDKSVTPAKFHCSVKGSGTIIFQVKVYDSNGESIARYGREYDTFSDSIYPTTKVSLPQNGGTFAVDTTNRTEGQMSCMAYLIEFPFAQRIFIAKNLVESDSKYSKYTAHVRYASTGCFYWTDIPDVLEGVYMGVAAKNGGLENLNGAIFFIGPNTTGTITVGLKREQESDETDSDTADTPSRPTRPSRPDDSSEPSYTVTAPAVGQGEVRISPKQAQAGDEVTVSVIPGKGYELDGITVTDMDGKKIRVTENKDGTFTFIMPDSQAAIAPIFVSVEEAPVAETPTVEGAPSGATPAAWTNPYTDVASTAWYYDAVGYVTANGLMTGTTSTAFAPSDFTTRAQIWTVLARMDGQSVTGGSPWYAAAQQWVIDSGISDGTQPTFLISREELATMLYRAAGSPAVNGDLSSYIDGGSVSAWAEGAVLWATQSGIIDGVSGALTPHSAATRAQVAVMLQRYLAVAEQ